MNELQIFNNEEFGNVRSLMIDNEPWLVGKDVAEALGYSNPQKALRDHVDEEDKTVNDLFTVNGAKRFLINGSKIMQMLSYCQNGKVVKTQGQNAPELGQHGSWLIDERGTAIWKN